VTAGSRGIIAMQIHRVQGLLIASVLALSVGCADSSQDDGDIDLQDQNPPVCSISDADCEAVCVKSGFGKCSEHNDPCAEYPDGVCPPPKEPGCTLSQGDWASMDPAAWPIDGLTIGDITYSNEALHEILNRSSDVGNASIILYRQYIAAVLNVAAGAGSLTIDEAAADTLAWFEENLGEEGLPGNVRTNTELGKEALDLANLLKAFNEGEVGPGACVVEEEAL
jgi:hypothetical protein